MYKAVVFDYGNVLCTIDRDSFVRKATLHSTLSPEAIRIALWDGKLELDYESGKFDSRKYFALAREAAHLDEDYGFDQFVEDYRQIIQPNPDGERGLSVARDLGARTFVLSNTSFLHARELFSNELLASIPELHILSYKVGVMKPHPRIWLKLLEYAHLEPEDCLYIDDVSEY
ncbi:MAG: hypothetical protein LLF89_00035 [Spirochaetaceae bacterium]|nr:hypothetical protein [Spirochaetaceae bacterium]